MHDKICREFNCTTWVAHQLAGSALKTSRSRPTHSDADWCKSFANYAYYAFVLCNPDKATGVIPFRCTKARRSEQLPDKLLKIRSDMKLIDVSNRYRDDEFQGIVEVDNWSRV